MVLMLVAAIQFGPWEKTSANISPRPVSEPSVGNIPPAASPVTAPPTAPKITSPPPAEAASTQTAIQPGMPSGSAAAKRPVRQTARQSSEPVQRSAAPASPQAAQVVPPPSTAEEPPQQPLPAKAARTGPDRAVLQELREQLVQLAARAGAVRNSLGNLKRSQEANGMSLRSDMAAAESRMNSLLEGANAALNAQDAASAKKFIDSADREVEKLEKFLGI